MQLLVDWTYTTFTEHMDSEQREGFDEAIDRIRRPDYYRRLDKAERRAQVQAMLADQGM